MAKKKFSVKKYDGDDCYSYAVFASEDVKGMGSVIFYGEAKPYVSGLDRVSANHYKKDLEEKYN